MSGEAYCMKCQFVNTCWVRGTNCDYPSNVIIKKKWWGEHKKYKRHPRKLNKDNNCLNYIQILP